MRRWILTDSRAACGRGHRRSSGVWTTLAALLLCTACDSSRQQWKLARDRALQAEALGRADWARHYWQIASASRYFGAWNRLGSAWSSGSEADLSRAEEAYRRHLSVRPADWEARQALIDVLLRARRVERAEVEVDLLPDPPRAEERRRLLELIDPQEAWIATRGQTAVDESSPADAERLVRLGLESGGAHDVLVLSDRLLESVPLSERISHLCLRVAREAGDAARAEAAMARVRVLAALASAGPAESLDLLNASFPALIDPHAPPVPWSLRLRWMRSHLALGDVASLRPHLGAWSQEAGRLALLSFSDSLARSGFAHLAEELRASGRTRFAGDRVFWERSIESALDRGELEMADRLLVAAVRACGEGVELLRLNAALNQLRGDAAVAERQLRRSVELAPWHLPPAEDLAGLLVTRGRSVEAQRVLEALPAEHDGAVRRLRERLGLP